MKLGRIFGLVILLIWIPWLAMADSSEHILRLSLRDALTMVHERQADVLMADERVNQALARMGQASSNLLPQFKGVVSGARQSRDLRGQGIALPGDPHIGPFNAFDARVKMTQAIFDPATMGRLNEAAKGKQLALAENRKLKEDILALVATMYINARQASNDLKAQRAQLTSDRQNLRSVDVQYKQGTASVLEWDQAKNRLAQSYWLWQQANTQEVETRMDLCAALDIPFDQKIEFMDEEIRIPVEKADESILQKHPDIEAAKQSVELRSAQRGLERSQRLPQISALADYGRSGESVDESSNTFTVGLQASVPIWEGGLRKERIKESESRLKESGIQLESTKRETRARYLSALEILKQAKVFKNQADIQLRIGERQLILAYKKYKMGNSSRLELLESWAARMRAVDMQAEAVSAYQSAQINLAHAMGMMESIMENHLQQENP
jgi:outer membrane protein TolC